MATTTEDTICIPEWLNTEFITDIITKEKRVNVSIVGMDVKLAVPKGDNYLSTMYRISVQHKENKDDSHINNTFLIVKTLPIGDFFQKLLLNLEGTKKEIHIYGTTFPSLYRIVQKKILNWSPLFARSFPTTRSDAIVLEDLKHLGYKMANRHKGLDLEHCKLAVRALARLHASSLVLYNTDPSSMDIYKEGMYVKNEERQDQTNSRFQFYFKTISSEVEKWSGYEHYAEKIMKLSSTALDRVTKDVKPKENSINVLNHGDCWVNNIMFRYCPETEVVQDIRFLDFQVSRFSSPALDLQYFLCMSPSDDVRYQQREHLLEVYHEELCYIMRQLGLDPDQFTLQQLKEEFEEKEFFGFFTSCHLLWAVYANKEDLPDFSIMKEVSVSSGKLTPMEKALSCPRFREVYQTLLLYYDKKGLL